MSDKKTRSALKSLITTNLPSGTAAISAADLREVVNSIVESARLILEAEEADYIVVNMSTTTPPGSPSDGDTYVVASGATGDWSGQDDNIAIYDGQESPAAWNFITPTDQIRIRNQADETSYTWDADASPAAWVADSGGAGSGLTATVTALALSGSSQTHNIASGTKFITLQSSAIVLSSNGRVQVQLKNGASTTQFSGVGITDGGSPANFTSAGSPGLAPLATTSTGNHYVRAVIHNPRDSGELTTVDIEGFSPGASQVYRRMSDADSATDDDSIVFSPSAGTFSSGTVYITEWS